MGTVCFFLLCCWQEPVPGFEDVTESVGLKGAGGDRACWADVNNDGYSDLFLGGALFLNEGGRRFVRSPGSPPAEGGAIAADFNNDGAIDAVLFGGKGSVYFGDGRGGFRKGEMEENPYPGVQGIAAGDLDRDGWVDVYWANYEEWKDNTYPFPDRVYKNLRGALRVRWETPKEQTLPGRGATFCDFDEDGDLDVYVSNYRLAPNFLWVNDGRGGLTDRAAELGCAGNLKNKPPIDYGDGRKVVAAGHTIGSAWADFDNDGHFDLLVGNFSHPAGYQDRVQLLRNTGKEGGWKFEDRSASANVRWQESYAGCCCADFDNDGRVDFFLPTVYERDAGALYRNLGDWKFEEVKGAVAQRLSYQAAWGDFDNDGFVDLMTNGKLYRNRGNKNSWVKVKLAGKKSNRAAIGARVVCKAGGQSQVRQVEAGTGSGNQNDLTVHFGLGSHTGEVELEIVWPSGQTQSVRGKARTLVKVEEKATAPPKKGGRK